MDSEVLFVMLLLIFMAIIAYVFLNCNCRCNIQEAFSNTKMTLFRQILEANKNNCTCENGIAENSNYGIGSQVCRGKTFNNLIGKNDLCTGICESDDYVDTGYEQDDEGKYFRKCIQKNRKAYCPLGKYRNEYRKCVPCPVDTYRSDKNTNYCLPCKSSCDNGKILSGKCRPGSTSDTTICTDKDNGTESESYEEIDNKITYYSTPNSNTSQEYDGYYPSGRYTALKSNNAELSKKLCNDMNIINENSCGAIYEYQSDYGGDKYYYAFSKNDEEKTHNSISIDDNGTQNVYYKDKKNIIPHRYMKYKYVKRY